MSGGRLPSLPVTDNRNYYLDTLDYGNGDSIQYEYDKLGRVTKQTYEDGETVSYRYDNNGALATVTDSETGIKTTYYYDFTDRMMKYVESGTDYSHSVGYEYDQLNNLTKIVDTLNGTPRTTEYIYDTDNRITSVKTDNSSTSYTYDGLGRISEEQTKDGETVVLTDSYTFAPNGSNTSTQVATHTIDAAGFDATYTYTYDDNGNILSISDGTYTTSYVYDSQNQLLRENNQKANKTWRWTYDNAGNILRKYEYAYTAGELGTPTDTVVYSYGDNSWGDLLTSYDGNTITYDGVGNMLTFDGNTYTWKHGRQLASMFRYGYDWTFTYNADGLRTSRSSVEYEADYQYYYNGSKLIRFELKEMYGEDYLIGYMDISYDSNGIPLSADCNIQYYSCYDEDWNEVDYYVLKEFVGTFYYVTNLQGDVIALVDDSGDLIAEYAYDAWGKLLKEQTYIDFWYVARYNPLRYRGYIYDQETGFYYVSSRYYDPEIGRFINADDIAYLGTGGLTSYNLFAYCGNNPVMGYDPYGTFDFWGLAKGVGRIVTGIAAVAAGVAVCVAGAPVAMIAVAAVTITAGVLTAVNGAADIQQSVTGNNFVRDTVFNGNQTAYDVYSGVTETVAAVGTAVCGNYLSTNCTMKGAVPGTEGKVTLEPGTTLDRYGSQYGRYLTDPGTSINQLALTPGNSCNLTTYVVNRPFTFRTGVVAPCAWGPGGGVQYFSWMSVQRLVQFGFLTPIG